MEPIAAWTVLLFKANTNSLSSRIIRPPNRSLLRPQTCLQCRIRAQFQTRLFVDDSCKKSRSNTNPSPSSPSIAEVTAELPSAEERRRSATTKRFSNLMDNLQGNIFIASQRINDLTGYSGIEALKSRITLLESQSQAAQEAVRSSRIAYKSTVADRAATQREVTTLLARKDSWSPTDLERFTSLYRMDHSNEQAVQEASTRLGGAERDAEHAANMLSSSILSRYHEEQIWSDKIRRMSTWGTWGLMGVNVLLFFVFQFGFEPWRRAKLVKGFEEKVREALEMEKLTQAERHNNDATRKSSDELFPVVHDQGLDKGTRNDDLAAVSGMVTYRKDATNLQEEYAALDVNEIQIPPALVQLERLEALKAAFRGLFSENFISIRKQDIAMVAFKGFVAGAAMASIVATLLVRQL